MMFRKLLAILGCFLLSCAAVHSQGKSAFSPAYQELDQKINAAFLELSASKAKPLIDEQAKIAQKDGNLLEKGRNAHNKGLYFFMVSANKDSILNNYKFAEQVYVKENQDTSLLQLKLSLISYYEKYDAKFDLLPLIEDCIKMADKFKIKKYIYRANRAKAKALSYSGRQVEALKIAYEIEKTWDQFSIEEKKTSPDPYVVFMAIYYSNGENEKTIEPLEKLVHYSEEIKDTLGLIKALNNIAPKYIIIQKDSNKYLSTLYKSIFFAKQINEKYGEANAYNQLVSYYLDHDLDSAKYYLNKIDQTLPVIEQVNFLGTVSRIRGLYYENIGNNRLAEFHYKKSKDIFFELGNLPFEKKAVNYLVDLNARMGDYKDAFIYAERKAFITDSLLNRNSIEAFKEAELQREFDQKRFEDSLQTLGRQQKQELVFQKAIGDERQMKMIILAVLLILLIVIVFIYVSLRRKKAVNKELAEKNEIIAKALDEKQVLLKEIHHRVKNNFQIISSLIELQSREIDDEQFQNLAKEGQNRIQSMALIHQKLYQNDDLNVELADFLNKLVGNIQAIYRLSSVETSVDIKDQFSVDIDTAIPLGLILNELITNAFKYAFNDSKQNELKVELIAGTEFHELTISDNGSGLPHSIDLDKANSLGLRLVKRLVRQLQGKLDYQTNNGAVFRIKFKDTLMRAQID